MDLMRFIVYAQFAIISIFVILAGIGWGKYLKVKNKLRMITNRMNKKEPISKVCSKPNNG